MHSSYDELSERVRVAEATATRAARCDQFAASNELGAKKTNVRIDVIAEQGDKQADERLVDVQESGSEIGDEAGSVKMGKEPLDRTS